MVKLQAFEQAPLALTRCEYPIRLAVQTSDGFPRIVSLWFKYRQGLFYAVTHRSAWIVQHLQKNGQVGFEIATNKPPYKGIRGTARAALSPLQDNLLEELIEHYLGNLDSDLACWLLSRKSDELVITITPRSVSSWDYSERMPGDIVHE